MTGRISLALRLALSSALWVAGALLVAGALIVFLFESHIERRFDQELADHLEELVAAAEVDKAGHLHLNWSPADPRLDRPLSGWYWQVLENDRIVLGSASIGTARLGAGFAGQGVFEDDDPAGKRLRLVARTIHLPRAAQAYLFIVAGPVSDIENDVHNFTGDVFVVLAVLAVLLVGTGVLQVVFGLRPLRRVQESLSAVRSGERDRLPGDFPIEVLPLVSELNALLDYNKSLLERARRQVGNLAHALKNPLSVLKGEVSDIDGSKGDLLRRQVGSASASVERYLHKARIAGAGNVLGARAELGKVVGDLKFTLETLYRQRNLNIGDEGATGVAVRMDPEDLEELLGNLMDNACKWATGRVRVSAHSRDGKVLIAVEDDGPGIPADKLEHMIRRGTRLDESEPGSGLGLSIAVEITALYGGDLVFEKSSLGGVAARLTIPGVGS